MATLPSEKWLTHRKGEHFGVEQVCADILDRWDLKQTGSTQDVGYTATAYGEGGCVGEVQQCSKRLSTHKVQCVNTLALGSLAWGKEFVEVGAAGS